MPMSNLSFVETAYLGLFRRPRFRGFNERVHRLALQSLGVMNWENPTVSGEIDFVSRLAPLARTRDTFTVLDVGANNGDYSTLILRTIPSSKVYAFEPNPLLFKHLQTSLSLTNFHPINAAVGSEDGEAILYDYDGSNGTGHASLFPGVIEDIHGNPSPFGHAVKQLKLDSFLESISIGWVDLMKIDVEGNELNVLNGCRERLKAGRFGVIQFEFNEMNLVSRVFFRDFAGTLTDYKLYRLLPQGMIRLWNNRYHHYQQEVFAYQNVVAILKGSVYDSAELTGQ